MFFGVLVLKEMTPPWKFSSVPKSDLLQAAAPGCKWLYLSEESFSASFPGVLLRVTVPCQSMVCFVLEAGMYQSPGTRSCLWELALAV